MEHNFGHKPELRPAPLETLGTVPKGHMCACLYMHCTSHEHGMSHALHAPKPQAKGVVVLSCMVCLSGACVNKAHVLRPLSH